MTKPGTARRRFFALAALTLPMPGMLVLGVVIRDWWLVVMGAILLPAMLGRLADAFNLAWPGSRFGGWHNHFPRVRLPKAIGIVVGLAFFALSVALLIILGEGLNRVALAVMVIFCALWILRLGHTIQTEGWLGDRRGEK